MEFDGLTGDICEQARGKHLSGRRLSAHESEIDRLHGELNRISSNDFFPAAGRATTAAYERCQKELRAAKDRKQKQHLPKPWMESSTLQSIKASVG